MMTFIRNSMVSLALAALPAIASGPDRSQQYQIEIKLYQVFTNVTGDGLTSQTLPGVNGSYQVLHESLDGVKLAMEGGSLTWDGKEAPDDPRIKQVSAPRIVTPEGMQATIVMQNEEELQYFERKDNGLFELKTHESKGGPIGVQIELTPRPVEQDPARLDCGFAFRYTWVKDREPIEGVALSVGKPIVESAASEGSIGCRLGEWSCYRTILSGEGVLYVFIKAAEHTADGSGVEAVSQRTTVGGK